MIYPDMQTQTKPFLAFLDNWLAQMQPVAFDKIVTDPDKAAILSVDVINGFCYEGPLASPRVAGIVGPIVNLFSSAWVQGVRQIILCQDTHEPDAVEFSAWPPHCVRGTHESETVDAIKALPFYNQLIVLPKNSISSTTNTGLDVWITSHPDIDTYIIVGDCTDLCTYQLAMQLRLDANAHQQARRVIVPADCSDTYDYSIEAATAQGGLPHPAGLMHAIFLYHMALNGIEIVRTLSV
jgi:nicotinamidase-related amidase